MDHNGLGITIQLEAIATGFLSFDLGSWNKKKHNLIDNFMTNNSTLVGTSGSLSSIVSGCVSGTLGRSIPIEGSRSTAISWSSSAKTSFSSSYKTMNIRCQCA